jgi:peptide/nickel transport system substrate-binding protein
MKKAYAISIVFVFLSALAFGGPRQQTSAARDSTFTVVIYGDIVSLDPAFAYDYTTGVVVPQIAETLLTYNERDELSPQIASSWKAVDNLTYVYTIRSDVTFSDGTPVTMEDVRFSVDRIRDPATGAYMQWMFSPVESITVTGPWELTVKLSVPSSSWPHVLATAGRIISKDYYEKHQNNFGTAQGGILATGAYVYESWTSGQEVVLKKNPNYWNKGVNAAMETLVFKIITEDTTIVTALQTGEVDYTSNPPLDMLDRLRADSSLDVIRYQSMGISFLAFNTQRAPFDEVNVRKAIYHAIDMRSLQTNIIKDAGSPGTVLPQGEGLYGNNPQQWRDYLAKAPVYEYNLAKAREYLAKSSVPGGFSASVLITKTSLSSAKALVLQDALAALNIKVQVVELTDDEHTNYQFGGVLDAGGKRDYDMIIAGWSADFPDIGGNLEPLYLAAGAGEGGTNTAAYVNPRVDALLQEQSTLTDVDARNRLIFQALDIITDEVPYIFFEYPNRHIVMNKKFTGLKLDTATSAATLRFYQVRLR